MPDHPPQPLYRILLRPEPWDVPARQYPSDRRDRSDEMRKVVTSTAIAGHPIVNLDNIDGELGDSSLDAALTATEWSDRLLGTNRTINVRLLTTWWATGNNVTVSGDTERRALPIILESPEERPEDREGFRHPDLLAWVRQERGRLFVAALTVLSAYVRVGRPDQGLKPFGSYEGWSALVRAAITWAGEADPILAREGFTETANAEVTALGAVLQTWSSIDPEHKGLTVRKAVEILDSRKDDFPELVEALAVFCPTKTGFTPTPKELGYRLRKYAKRVVGGRRFINLLDRNSTSLWFVEVIAPQTAGDGGVNAGDEKYHHPQHHPHDPSGKTGPKYDAAGDAGDTLRASYHTGAHARAGSHGPQTSPASPASPAARNGYAAVNGCHVGAEAPDDSDGGSDSYEHPADRLFPDGGAGPYGGGV